MRFKYPIIKISYSTKSQPWARHHQWTDIMFNSDHFLTKGYRLETSNFILLSLSLLFCEMAMMQREGENSFPSARHRVCTLPMEAFHHPELSKATPQQAASYRTESSPRPTLKTCLVSLWITRSIVSSRSDILKRICSCSVW